MNVAALLVSAAFVACRDGVAPPAVAITNVVLAPNPNNVLSAVVTYSSSAADSVRVEYATPNGFARSTPADRSRNSNGRIVVLGLRASSVYEFTIEAFAGGAAVRVAAGKFTTSALPADIAQLRLRGSGTPSNGFTLVVPVAADTTVDADGYVLVFDAAGEVCWYRAFPHLWPVEAKQQANGLVTVYAGRSFGWQPTNGRFIELGADGAEVRSFAASAPYYTDPHELLLSASASGAAVSHLLAYELGTYDLRAAGGSANAVLATHTIERHDAAGATVFRWRAREHLGIDSLLTAPAIPDLDHPSSLALDRDGNYVVSFQGLDEITKIDAITGAVLWRLGGRANQFRIANDPLNGFSGQHHVQALSNGNLLLMDNHTRSRGPARAAEYALDTKSMVATLVWEYRPSPAVSSMSMGSVQRLPNGATLVGFGAAGQVAEVGVGGTVWSAALRKADGAALSFYRAIRLPSLFGFAPDD